MEIPGYITAAVILIGMLFEVVPIKVSPLAWIGRRLNRDTNQKVDKINRDLQEHIADDMRSYILSFQKQLIQRDQHTQEDFRRAYNMCDKYEIYIKENKLKNSEIEEAIAYIRSTYRHCLQSGDFDSPT
ncbi:MAG: hypothetical protein PHW47_08395 [Lachnospira sp.]|nr:hypothetical protein [Lachnospira sp.]